MRCCTTGVAPRIRCQYSVGTQLNRVPSPRAPAGDPKSIPAVGCAQPGRPHSLPSLPPAGWMRFGSALSSLTLEERPMEARAARGRSICTPRRARVIRMDGWMEIIKPSSIKSLHDTVRTAASTGLKGLYMFFIICNYFLQFSPITLSIIWVKIYNVCGREGRKNVKTNSLSLGRLTHS